MEDLFDTEEKKSEAIAAFQGLMNHPGWKLLQKLMDIDIENFRKALENGAGEDETIDDIKRMRKQLAFLVEHRDKPEDLIKKLQSDELTEPNDDPFDTVDDLKKQRGEVA